MRLPGDDDDRGIGAPVVYTIIGVSVFILVVLAAVFISNNGQKNTQAARKNLSRPTSTPAQEEEMRFAQGQEDMEELYRENKLRAEDLDFWDMYEKEEETEEAAPTASPSPTPSHEPTEEELAADGMHVKVTRHDGTEEWVEISDTIPLYTYDFTNIKINGGKMEYYLDGEKNSSLGVELSKDSGEVDFEALKKSGVDFVMVKLGGRGYESGVISLDENFVANITNAQNAGLEVGVTFFSQAVSVQEAQEEAEFVASNLIPYKITYPVAYVMEYIANDEARIEALDEAGKTKTAETFLSYMEKEGYHPILYGNTDWLLGELQPRKLLGKYDIWLNDQSPVPDYPYQFKMWKYGEAQQVEGIEKETPYIISFVDYTRR